MITQKEIEKTLRTAKGPNAKWLTDAGDRGSGRLVLQVRARDGKATADWFAMSRRDGKRVMVKIGRYPDVSLAEARRKFREEFEPRIMAGEGPRPPAPKAVGTVADLFASYIADLKARGARSAYDIECALAPAAKALGKDKLASAVTPGDVTVHVRSIYAGGAVVRAERARQYISAAFAYGLKAENDPTRESTASWGLSSNPAKGVRAIQAANRARDRYLNPEELRVFWNWLVAHKESSLMAHALLLRIATGQRGEEILKIATPEAAAQSEGRLAAYDKAEGMVTWAKTKSGAPHAIPLPRQAREVLDALPLNRFGLYFPCRGHAARPATHGALQETVARFLKDHPEVPPFQPRDIRRTWKTLAGAAGISREVRDLIQNHARQDVGSRHYDKYSYNAEKKAAMERWSDYLDKILAGPAPVVTLRPPEVAA